MNVGQDAHLSGQAAQMNQVANSGVGVGVGSADGLQQHQPMQDMASLTGTDQQFVMFRTTMRKKIFEYIGRKQSSSEWRKRLPELAKRLEEILCRKFPNRNDYYNMLKGPVEPQLQFAIKTLSAQNQQNQQNPQMSRQIASSSGYGTMIPTTGMTQGTSGNSRVPYVAMSDMELPQHQPMEDMAALSGVDQQFVMLRTAIREKIFVYIERTPLPDKWEKRLTTTVLARRLEEVLYTKLPNKNDYYNMMNGPIEPQLLFAIKTYKAQKQLNQQDPQMARETASSSGTITEDVNHAGLYEQFASLLADMQNENADELVRTESLPRYGGGSD